MRTAVKIALDWIPNMLHAGLLYAYVMGWFQEEGLCPELISPEVDSYSMSNEHKLLNGLADIAIMPSEVIFENNELRKQKLVPFANILQKNTSAILTLQSSGISRPSELGGMRYGAIEIPYEVNIIRALINADGSEQPPFVICPNRLLVWEDFLRGKVDAVWAFSVIEGVESELKGIKLNTFRFEDYGIPYPAVPFFVVTKEWKDQNPNIIANVYGILSKAYQTCFSDPEKVARVLADAGLHHYANDYDFNLSCLQAMKPFLLDQNNNWGIIDHIKLDKFRSWLINQNLISYENEALVPIDLF
jgi:ABC-type nitrate/sulfonate/bicarbonate transport system substrate-binding protein